MQTHLLRIALAAAMAAPVFFAADTAPGTVGIGMDQIYDDSVPNKRGAAVVLNVVDKLPAALAGIRVGDLVIGINKKPIEGRSLEDVFKDLRGPVGTVVHFEVVRLDEGRKLDLDLVMVPFPIRHNPDSDAFSYSWPGDWRPERFQFPLPFASALTAYHGMEDLVFMPNFADLDSPEYHSFVFFWWLDQKPEFSASRLEQDLATYFRGVSDERAGSEKFTVDPSKLFAKVTPAGDKRFRAEVSIYNRQGKVVPLHIEAVEQSCPGDHTVLWLCLSPQARDSQVWPRLRSIRDSFHCKST